MNHNDLPERWRNKLKEYLKSKDSKFETLSASDFSSNKIVEINFVDGSFATFRYPLVIKAPELNEIGIMTEHCGYFIFHQEAIQYELKCIAD